MSSTKSGFSNICIFAAFLLLFVASVFGQSFRGSIRGVVTDPSGGVLANAKVTAKNINTGLQREASTGPDGSYVIAELPAGEYTVTAQAAQLSPAAQNVQVNVGLDTSCQLRSIQDREACRSDHRSGRSATG